MTARQASLLDAAPPSDAPTIKDQILAAELWALGKKDWLERFSAGPKKRPDQELANERKMLAAARAIIETLKGVERDERRVAS